MIYLFDGVHNDFIWEQLRPSVQKFLISLLESLPTEDELTKEPLKGTELQLNFESVKTA